MTSANAEMRLLADTIKDFSAKLTMEAQQGLGVNLEDCISLQNMAESLAACVLAMGVANGRKPHREGVLGALRDLSEHDRLWIKRCLAADDYEDFLKAEHYGD